MSTWVRQRIGQLGTVVTGKTPPTKELKYYGNNYPFITPSDIQDYKIRSVSNVERYLSNEWINKAPNYLLPQNTICYVCIGSTVGKSCLTKTESFSNQQINSLICNPQKADAKFIFYLLKQKTPEIKKIADSSGAGKGIINKTSFEKLEINIPDVKTQMTIGHLISTYDDLIESNEKRVKTLEEMAQRLYVEWFVKFNFPGHEKVRMIDSGVEYGNIPEGWKVANLGEVAKIVRGCSYSTEEINDYIGEYYIVNLKSFNRGGGFRFDGEKYYSGSINSNQSLSMGDVVIAVTDMTTDRAVIARPARIPEISGKITFSADVVKINSHILPNSFVYQLLSSYRFTETTKQMANGANVLHLKPAAILEFITVIPDEQSLNSFDALCEPVAREIDKLLKQNDNLSKTRDLLIPQLVTGKRELKN